MDDLEIGQVLSLRIKIPYHGVFDERHPYLILKINADDGYIEVGQLHSLHGKAFEAIDVKNKVIFNSNPEETVIDTDSFIQKHNKITIELYDELVKYRRQPDKLSESKLNEVITEYEKYHKEHHISDDRVVYLDREDIEDLND